MTEKLISAVDENILTVMTDAQKVDSILDRFRCKRDLYDYM